MDLKYKVNITEEELLELKGINVDELGGNSSSYGTPNNECWHRDGIFDWWRCDKSCQTNS